MPIDILDRSIQKIAVIGSGQIGPDIALHFSKVFAPHGVPIVVVDISDDALAAGRAKLDKKVDRGIESGAFKPDAGVAMKSNVTFTSDYDQVRGSDLVVEAATEDRALKGRIFSQISGLVDEGAILASNSSHLEPEAIFESISNRSRAMVVHYFFPAKRNPVVEVVPGADTDPAIGRAVSDFYEAIGKVPITVGSRYGYAIDPIFEGLFLAAALLAEEGAGTTREIDAVACEALDYTVGPFTAMNLTGGNPITNVGLDNYTTKIHSWFRSPQSLKDAVAAGSKWDTPKRGEKVEVDEAKRVAITEALRGAYFGICGEIVDSGISNVADLDMAVELALDMFAPFRLMNQIGVGEALRLVSSYAAKNAGFPIPECIRTQANRELPFTIPTVIRRDEGDVAVLTIRRPKALNALNNEAFSQIEAHIRTVDTDPKILGTVITGFGVKAFVSGADVNFLAKIDSSEMGEATSWGSNQSLLVVENSKKPVVCVMNGLAFGGGNELAMACDARIARAGQKVFVGQPEPNLGIIPGAGGTQRLPRWIGMEAAARILRTGRPISSAEALTLGLISEEVTGTNRELVDRGIAIVQNAANGEAPLKGIERGPIQVPEALDDVPLGHLSTAVDAILCRALLEGCRMPLDDGLKFEAKMFGAVCGTKDFRIGVTNFVKNGPRSKAEFTNS